MSLYVYCLGDELTRQAVEGVEGVEGVGDAQVRVESFGKFVAVVSEFEGARVRLTRENVEAHNRVNGRVLAETTPLPFRFGTLVEAERLAAYLQANEAALSTALARVSGAVEMSVKVLWDTQAELREALGVEPASDDAAQTSSSAGSGAAFLEAKRRELAGAAALAERAEEIRAWLAEGLGDAVREERVTLSAAQALVVRAAHLVERERLAEYRARLEGLRREREARLRFLTSGAWPPYSFGEI
ncbi:MAG TPA: GvpL/GvpF family gas vesicle protein [Pyrinomonadaceae bacterium]|nr:GvpL/GvpF family gas vesicle protein [Pyrinomonadaceae bacterium]